MGRDPSLGGEGPTVHVCIRIPSRLLAGGGGVPALKAVVQLGWAPEVQWPRLWRIPDHNFEKVRWRTSGNVEEKPKSRPGRTDGEQLPEERGKDAARVQVVRRSPNRRSAGFNVEMARRSESRIAKTARNGPEPIDVDEDSHGLEEGCIGANGSSPAAS